MIHLNIKLTHVYLENMIMDIIDHLHQQVQGRDGGGIHRAIPTFQMLQSYHSIVFHSYCPIVILFVHSEDIHEVLHKERSLTKYPVVIVSTSSDLRIACWFALWLRGRVLDIC